MIDKSTRLFKAIKAGKLEVTQKNVNAVQKAYCEAVYLEEGLRQARLDKLPDPEGISSYPEVFELWLIEAFATEEDPKEEVRKRLHWVRDKVIKSVR